MCGFDEYDMQKLEEAKRLLTEVYEFNFGDTKAKRQNNRLKTVIDKLAFVMKLNANSDTAGKE